MTVRKRRLVLPERLACTSSGVSYMQLGPVPMASAGALDDKRTDDTSFDASFHPLPPLGARRPAYEYRHRYRYP